jgi:hypothetical protein
VPEPLRHRGVLWWRSQLTRYVFRPLPFVLEYISHRRAAIGWPGTTHHHHPHHPHNDQQLVDDQQEITQEQEERVSEASARARESPATGPSERGAGEGARRGGGRQQQGQAVVGVHVRHGDKSWDVVHQGSYIGALPPYIAKAQRLYARARACRDAANSTDAGHAEAYEDAAKSSARQFACKPRYFISTDDASVLDEARDMGLDVFWDAEEAR